MESKQEVSSIITQYLHEFKGEDHRDLLSFTSDNELLFTRKNFNGHITASAFIIDATCTQLLLLKHKLYDRYLQPGGHIEQDDTNILEAALREASEETGIPQDELLYIPVTAQHIPIDIDSHYIPPNALKNEPEHVHHDFRYLFVYEGNKNLVVPINESRGAKWIDLSQLENEEIFSTVVQKIKLFR